MKKKEGTSNLVEVTLIKDHPEHGRAGTGLEVWPYVAESLLAEGYISDGKSKQSTATPPAGAPK